MRCQPVYRFLALFGLLASVALAADTSVPPARSIRLHDGYPVDLVGGSPVPGKADRDTVYLLGGPDRFDGRFEDEYGNANWHGWTGIDFTLPIMESFWNVSDFNAAGLNGHPAGNLAMWCGAEFDGDPGYGNDWDTFLDWTGEPPVPGEPVTVSISAFLNHDVEEGWDFLYLQVARADGWEDLQSFNGARQNLAVDQTVVLQPMDYAEDGIRLRWHFVSDSAFSDEDELLDTDGACQIDDITVLLDGELATFDDFEPGSPVHWTEPEPTGVGGYAALYENLMDIDPCVSNQSWQVAFVDDGEVVPGTGGSVCVTWCYGPGGYVLNHSGGLMGPDFYLHCGVVSPPVAIPAGFDGLTMEWGVYVHTGFGDPDWSGITTNWSMRSTASEDPEDLASANWVNRSFIELFDVGYRRASQRAEDLLEPGARYLQLSLEAWEIGYNWGFNGSDATPAPYYDNVAIKMFNLDGPTLRAASIHLAQDTFPERGELDYAVLSANHCRFDMAQNISVETDLRNDPGDSLVIDAAPRIGAVMVEPPRMIVAMRPNPLFDVFRQIPAGWVVVPGGLVTGTVVGDSCRTSNGTVIEDRYCFDLPDTGFFYPGDEIHYFFEATDDRAGEVGLSRLPADTTGFTRFTGRRTLDTVYPLEFQVRALPSLESDIPGDQPRTLFWFDGADVAEYHSWSLALAHGGMDDDEHFDTYYTQAANAGVGNGLGGRATPALLEGYDVLLYTCDDLSTYTLANGDFAEDPSRDLQVLTGWFELNDKRAFLVGDNLASSLENAGTLGHAFNDAFLGVDVIAPDVSPYIGMQMNPLLKTIPGNGVVVSLDEFIGAGGCPRPRAFDALETATGTVRVAEYTDINGQGGIFSYAPMTYRDNATFDARVVLLNQALGAIEAAPGYTAPVGYAVPPSSLLLRDVLYFLAADVGPPIAAPELPASLSVTAGPNPFNPRTVIKLNLARGADAQVKIYDLRGALVRTLQDGPLAAGAHELTWSGEDQQGRQAASGVYFYEVKAAGETRLGKLTLVK